MWAGPSFRRWEFTVLFAGFDVKFGGTGGTAVIFGSFAVIFGLANDRLCAIINYIAGQPGHREPARLFELP